MVIPCTLFVTCLSRKKENNGKTINGKKYWTLTPVIR